MCFVSFRLEGGERCRNDIIICLGLGGVLGVCFWNYLEMFEFYILVLRY